MNSMIESRSRQRNLLWQDVLRTGCRMVDLVYTTFTTSMCILCLADTVRRGLYFYLGSEVCWEGANLNLVRSIPPPTQTQSSIRMFCLSGDMEYWFCKKSSMQNTTCGHKTWWCNGREYVPSQTTIWFLKISEESVQAPEARLRETGTKSRAERAGRRGEAVRQIDR